MTPAVKQFVYTLSGQIKEIASATGSRSSLEEFTYDGSGNRTKKVTTPSSGSPATTSYAYNQVNQLCWKLGAASAAGCSGKSPGGVTAGTTAAHGRHHVLLRRRWQPDHRWLHRVLRRQGPHLRLQRDLLQNPLTDQQRDRRPGRR